MFPEGEQIDFYFFPATISTRSYTWKIIKQKKIQVKNC